MARGLTFKMYPFRKGRGQCSHYGALSYPIYQTATYAHPGVGQWHRIWLQQTAEPDQESIWKTKMAALENGIDAFAFSRHGSNLTSDGAVPPRRPSSSIQTCTAEAFVFSTTFLRKKRRRFSGIDCCRENVETYETKTQKAIYIENSDEPHDECNRYCGMAEIAKKT